MDFRKFFDFLSGGKKASGPTLVEQSEAENMRLYGIHETEHLDPTGPAVVLNESQTRHLATGALLLAAWWLPLKQIMTVPPHTHQKIITMLERDWGVTTAAEVEQMIRNLLDEGHRARFQPQLEQNAAYWQAQFNEHEFLRASPVHSVAGWDFGRVVCLAYWALLVGLLDQQTAFAYMQEANILSQKSLNSWQDLAASYMGGMIMWNPARIESVTSYSDYARFLLEHPQSVWRLVPWSGR